MIATDATISGAKASFIIAGLLHPPLLVSVVLRDVHASAASAVAAGALSVPSSTAGRLISAHRSRRSVTMAFDDIVSVTSARRARWVLGPRHRSEIYLALNVLRNVD